MNLRQRLKNETFERHQQLEAAIDVLAKRTLAEYQVLLERFYGFYLPTEQAAAKCPESLRSVIQPRLKLATLTADLLTLGYDDGRLDALPLSPRTPPQQTVPQTLGVWYVLEGSTLGGQHIARHFAQTLGERVTGALSFYRSYGPNLAPMWRSYCELLEGHTDPALQQQAVEAANETFDLMRQWLVGRTS